MFGKYKASVRRVILINFDGVNVYGLCDGVLTQINRFLHEDQDFTDFRAYLASVPRAPVTVMVDSIAEDFIVESVAHTSFLDRKNLLKRKLNQHFRGIEYASAMIFGREKKGRKDDRVLYSAFTKNDLLTKWIKCLLLEHVPIVSITSPAYAMPDMAREFGFFTASNILLVNWEESGLRQTFFKDEKALFSRLIPVSDEHEGDLVESVRTSSIQSKEYLERNELLSTDDILDVHVITPKLSDDAFELVDLGKGFRAIQHHNPSNQIELYCYSGEQEPITAVILCIHRSLKAGARIMENVYGPASALHFHHLNLAKRFIGICSLGVVALGVLLSLPMLMDAYDRQVHQRQLVSNTTPLQMMYESLLEDLPESDLPAITMELAVNSYENINRKLYRPIEMMTAVSQALDISPSIDLGTFAWSHNPSDSSLNLMDAILQSQTEVSVELHGTLLDSESHQDSDYQLQSFIGLLNTIPRVQVTPIRLHIQKEPESEVSTTIGDEVLETEFSLNVRHRI